MNWPRKAGTTTMWTEESLWMILTQTESLASGSGDGKYGTGIGFQEGTQRSGAVWKSPALKKYTVWYSTLAAVAVTARMRNSAV